MASSILWKGTISARAVIMPLTDFHMVEWRLLDEGDRLRMFEGP